MKEAVDDMMVTLNEAASEVGMVGGMVESIAEAMAKVSPGFICHTWLCLETLLVLYHFVKNKEKISIVAIPL